MTDEQKQQIVGEVFPTTGFVKITTGICNNAAWLTVLEAYDHLKPLKAMRKQVKGGHTVKAIFKMAMKAYKEYERKLLYTEENRFFHLADMPESSRKRYGNITDGEYYEMWCNLGGSAYTKHHAFITALQNKYRKVLLAHKIDDSDALAWGLTGIAALSAAKQNFELTMKTACERITMLPDKSVRYLFSDFDMSTIYRLWYDAVEALSYEAVHLDITETEEKDLEHGIEDLGAKWISEATIPDTLRGAVSGFDDIFRTQGEYKKTLKEIDEFEDNLEENS